MTNRKQIAILNIDLKLWAITGFPGDSDSKESAYKVGNLRLIPGLGRSPKKGMATHSSILAWRIPRTEEPGGLQSMELERVGYDWVTKHTSYEKLHWQKNVKG